MGPMPMIGGGPVSILHPPFVAMGPTGSRLPARAQLLGRGVECAALVPTSRPY